VQRSGYRYYHFEETGVVIGSIITIFTPNVSEVAQSTSAKDVHIPQYWTQSQGHLRGNSPFVREKTCESLEGTEESNLLIERSCRVSLPYDVVGIMVVGLFKATEAVEED